MSSNTTAIEREAALYDCTILAHSSGTHNGLYAYHKGKEVHLCTWQDAQSLTLAKVREVCQELSGRHMRDYWTGGQA